MKYTQPYDPWLVWGKAKERGASDTRGWYIQSALQLIKDMNFSAAYINIGGNGRADLYTLKYYIYSGKAITTGSKNGDWGKIVET